ncbi:MAG: hypothetical protein IPF68_11845 [Bacteroidales bacterium]|nr:hypothetical protein [Bacteroidales bacterium]
MKKLITLSAIGIMLISTMAFAQKTWTGTSSTNWNTAGNWSPVGAPTASDNVTIPSAPVNQPLISGSLSPVCNNLTINTGASLTISSTMSNEGMLTASGNAIINGSLSLTGAGTITLKVVNITWGSGSSMVGSISGGIHVSGNWEFSAGSSTSMGFSTVTFLGGTNSTITSNSVNSNFYNLLLSKTEGATVNTSATSTSTLTINGNINIGSGVSLAGQANITTILKGNLINAGNIYMSSGILSLERTSGTQSVQINTNDYFNSVNINTGGTVTISTAYMMQLMGNMVIQSGVLDPNGSTIGLFGNWTNNAGTAGFTEGTSTVIFNGGNYHQYCSNENFYTLEVHKAAGGAFRMNGTTVICSRYNWTAGAIDVLNGGTFTANDVVDDAIAGNFYCNANCNINLSNYGGNIDLRGNLYIYGGNFNVYGGINPSWWPYLGNASITMSGGVLNFADQGILIRTDPTYTLSNNITGGTIRTAGNFTSGRTDFIPAAGTVELYGSANANLSMNAGNLFNLTINKATTNTVTLATNATVNGALTVQGGTLLSNNRILFTTDNISVNNGGTLSLENAAILRVTGSKAITIASGGTLKAIGTSASRPIITSNASSGHHEFQVNGTISARYAIFEYNYGINIWSTATVDPLNPFDQCTFQYGVDRFLLFSNNQELMIRGASFPTAPVYNNVWKNNNAGRVNFRDATGAYAGEAYDLDPYNRVDWTTSQPGLWTGAVSTDWHTAGNWDDLMVPGTTTDVTIPAGPANMPVTGSSTAYCNDLNITGQLTIQAGSLHLDGNAFINGNITMNHISGILNVQGSIIWNSGSTANITTNSTIRVRGDWTYNNGADVQLTNGSVIFEGFTFTRIYIYDDNSTFHDIYVSKTESSNLSFDPGSTFPIRAKNFYVDYNSEFFSNAAQNIIVSGNFYSFSTTQLINGAIQFEGSDQIFIPHPAASYHDIVFNQSGTVTLNHTNTNMVDIKGDITINSGVFNAENSIIKIEGSWVNNAGEASFSETGSRVIFSGITPQFCSTEHFDILEIDKAMHYFYDFTGSSISCQVYDWSQGGIWIAGGSTFYAADLADDGIYGHYVLWGNTIELHQDAGQSINLLGNISINGGEFIIDGGNDLSRWGEYGNASLFMNAGILDIKGYGLTINDAYPYAFTGSISAGTIRTQGSFITQSPGFNPIGGLVEFYGTGNHLMQTLNGSSFYDVKVNRSDNFLRRLSVYSSVVKNNFIIEEGMAEVTFGSELQCGNNLEIQDGGLLALTSGTLSMGNLAAVNVFQNGIFSSFGYEGAISVVKGISSENVYSFSVNSGGNIEAVYTVLKTCRYRVFTLPRRPLLIQIMLLAIANSAMVKADKVRCFRLRMTRIL